MKRGAEGGWGLRLERGREGDKGGEGSGGGGNMSWVGAGAK